MQTVDGREDIHQVGIFAILPKDDHASLEKDNWFFNYVHVFGLGGRIHAWASGSFRHAHLSGSEHCVMHVSSHTKKYGNGI